MTSRILKIIVDGIIYRLQFTGGISRVFNELLPRLCNLSEDANIILIKEGRVKQALPQHPRIAYRNLFPIRRYIRFNRTGRPILPFINRALMRLCIGDGSGAIWHSTYYTFPDTWDGKQVVTVHDMVHERFTHLFNSSRDEEFRQQKRKCIQKSDAVICVSETTRCDVIKFCNIKRESTFVVPLASSEAFRPLSPDAIPVSFKTRKPFLLYIGSRVHYKNFDLLIKAYCRWSFRNEVDLLLIGPKMDEKEKSQYDKLGILENIDVLSNVNDTTLCQIYHCAVALVYPSLYEGFGIPLLEAMSCGCPVVASLAPSNVEIGGGAPYFFKSNDENDLMKTLNIVIAEQRRGHRIQLGLQRAQSFSWDVTAQKTLQIYKVLTSH